MSHSSRLAMLFTLALSAVPCAAGAHPSVLANGPSGQGAAPIVKAGCYYEDCGYARWHCWRRCDLCCGYWRPRYSDPDEGYYHSRYYSHYRSGSYHRYWRPWWDRSGWGD